jgi:hypothetical protein
VTVQNMGVDCHRGDVIVSEQSLNRSDGRGERAGARTIASCKICGYRFGLPKIPAAEFTLSGLSKGSG